MKKISMIEESLYEFAKRGRPKKRGRKPKGIDAPDAWGAPEPEEEVNLEDIEDLEVDTSDMENVEEIEVEEEDIFDDRLFKALSNEVKIAEPSRRILKFRVKGDLEKVLHGVPMAKIGDNAFVFKLQDGKLKKIFLRDIILEQEKASNRAKTVNEYFPETDERNWVSFSMTKSDYDRSRKRRNSQDDDDDDDHNCLDYVDQHGRCKKCGKWYRPKEDDV